ncbi:MAG: hypothetical protein DMF23_11535 [Verrucomicrobia bacterium]|nr:MAG: hypothetical protein DMF23_11535 [Verrucomicrobiota bacterium]
MKYQNALDKLWNHANLPEKGLKREDSFLFTAWQAEQTRLPQDFQRLYEDTLSCLAVINIHLNGAVPSETITETPRPIDSALCYSMSAILCGGWSDYFKWSQKGAFPKDFLDAYASMLVRIGIAWDLVLAGDMDSIPEDTELEFRMQQA